jgi:hypothetical protein
MLNDKKILKFIVTVVIKRLAKICCLIRES